MLGEVKGKVKRAGRKEEIERRGGGRRASPVLTFRRSLSPFGFVVTVAAAAAVSPGPENIAIVH